MFYSQFILAKKGPLGTIWIAAHLERKLRKNQVADTDIGVSVDSILFPEVPIALRLSSHLLLGVVRIYSKKVNYLFDDCSEALLKVKQAFRSTAVDLPPEQSKAPYHSITLPETFDLDDFELPDNEIFHGNFVDHHVSTREQITLQDTMDGVAFPTSQFGPDERFGDGDASQIGLDLDEDLFLDKGEAAGTSGVIMDMDVEPQTSVTASSPSKGDDHTEGIPEPSSASPANYFSIQAPSTPGLMEEPNLPSAEEALVSDDHMDEDHNPPEVAPKEVSGPESSQPEPSNFSNVNFHANKNCQDQSEVENEKGRTLGVECSNETVEPISTGTVQLLTSSEHVEATDGPDNIGNIVDGSSLKGESMQLDIQSKGLSEDNEISFNPGSMPSPQIASVSEGHNAFSGNDKADLNGVYPIMLNMKSENDKSSVGSGVPTGETEMFTVSSVSEPLNAGQPCLNPEIHVASDPNTDNRLSDLSIPVLQACNAHVQHGCNGVDSLFDASNQPGGNDGLSSLGTSGKEDTTNISDAMKTTMNADQMTHAVTDADSSYLDGKPGNVTSEENNLEKENNSRISDFSAPEKLLSMPHLGGGQSDELFVEFTPAKEGLAEGAGDATVENIVSGKKRSYTESTLTIQSLNSAESSGAQSKRSVEFVPDDDDLLSSILVGKRSTTLKMKSTPPVIETVRAKRQRVVVRASAHKRKVLMDDAMVLHGDMIRQQLTDTEDIRRVRKKAPCTHLEIWMLQKQFLEDEIFSEPVFTGMSGSLISLDTEAFDLRRIAIIQEDVSKGANEVDTSKKPTLGEEAEHVGNCMSSTARHDGEQEHGGILENPSHQESILCADGDILQKETKAADDEVIKEVSGEKVEIKIGGERVSLGENMGSEHAVASSHTSEANCNSSDGAIANSSHLNKNGDVVVPGPDDASCCLMDPRHDLQSTWGDASAMEDGDRPRIRDQEGANLLEKFDSDERLDAKFSEEAESIDNGIPRADVQDHFSVPLEGGACPTSDQVIDECQLTETVPFQDGVCTTSDQVMEECQATESCPATVHDELLASEQRHDGSGLTSNNLGDVDYKLDSSCAVEADLSSQNTLLKERENPEYWEADAKIDKDSTNFDTDYNYAGDHAEFGMDTIEHDTDFLNVDDDEVAEDYESDMPNAEEKRVLDNTGWSGRTRAVAKYLQVLFEKEANHGKQEVSLDSLLAGKTRKEASRMFFETLVLKTKDYIHAQQENSFCDIRIKPRGNLLKPDF